MSKLKELIEAKKTDSASLYGNMNPSLTIVRNEEFYLLTPEHFQAIMDEGFEEQRRSCINELKDRDIHYLVLKAPQPETGINE